MASGASNTTAPDVRFKMSEDFAMSGQDGRRKRAPRRGSRLAAMKGRAGGSPSHRSNSLACSSNGRSRTTVGESAGSQSPAHSDQHRSSERKPAIGLSSPFREPDLRRRRLFQPLFQVAGIAGANGFPIAERRFLRSPFCLARPVARRDEDEGRVASFLRWHRLYPLGVVAIRLASGTLVAVRIPRRTCPPIIPRSGRRRLDYALSCP